MKTSQDLTILLLLKGRDEFTFRWFEYAQHVNLPYKVLIADGGLDNGLEKELIRRGYSKHVDYEYVRYPFDSSLELFYKKTFDALSRVKTPYVLLASNDDFYFNESIDTSVQFLKNNQDYVSSRGKIYDFSISESKGLGRPNTVYGQLRNLIDLYPNPTIDDEQVLNRLHIQISKFHSIWHDVNYTHILKSAFHEVIKYNILDINFYEHSLAFCVVAEGKIHRSEQLHMLHQAHPNSVSVSLVPNTVEWTMRKNWAKDLEKLIDLVARKITSEEEGCDSNIIKYMLLKDYINFFVVRKLAEEFLVKSQEKIGFKFILKIILNKSPSLYNFFSLLRLKFNRRNNLENLPDVIRFKVEEINSFLNSSSKS